MTKWFVVDTNVLVVANGGHGQADEGCVEAAIDSLLEARANGVLVDEGRQIFEQYRRYASHKGQPGSGDAFWKWLWDNQANVDVCQQVALDVVGPHSTDFGEFPSDPDLTAFDRSDRVFVAVALGSLEDPEILNASDTDWWLFRAALEKHGVRIRFLCPGLME